MRPIRTILVSLLALLTLAPASANAWCLFQCSYTRTRYPVVLAHGLAGYDSAYGVLDYWYGIAEALRDGGATVFVTKVNPFQTTADVRGIQLLEQVEEIVALTGKAKVNLIGHSQGALDARYVAALRPDLVASVTSVGGPNRGSKAASFNAAHPEIVDALVVLWNALADEPAPDADARAAIASLTPAQVAKFNAVHPAGVPKTACGEGAPVANGVRYYSWSGVGTLTNVLDPFDPFVAIAALVVGEPNDGVTGRCSSHLGDVIRDDYLLNHLDEVNQMLGLVPLFEANPVSLYRAHASRLRNAGL